MKGKAMASEVKTPEDQETGQTQAVVPTPVALDVSLERARALHRVWRAMNDGDCPKCHVNCTAQGVRRNRHGDMECPYCGFVVLGEEVTSIEREFAPAMDAAVAIFEQWRASR